MLSLRMHLPHADGVASVAHNLPDGHVDSAGLRMHCLCLPSSPHPTLGIAEPGLCVCSFGGGDADESASDCVGLGPGERVLHWWLPGHVLHAAVCVRALQQSGLREQLPYEALCEGQRQHCSC